MRFHSLFRNVRLVICGGMLATLCAVAERAQGEEAAAKAKADAVVKPEAVLMQAKVFEQDKPPAAFVEGSCWESWIFILEHPGGADVFERILHDAKTTPAGKLYALCGLYFCDYARFKKKLEGHRAAPMEDQVTFQRGDQMYDLRMDVLIEDVITDTKYVRLWYGESLSDYISRTHELLPLDVAGGGIPVRLLDESWVYRAGTIDFAEYGVPSAADGMELVRVRERFYRRWRTALELNAKKPLREE